MANAFAGASVTTSMVLPVESSFKIDLDLVLARNKAP